MTKIESGCLLIADITGYTAYLSDSELEHAQETLSELLELLIQHTRPPLIISRLAGDAVISYALGDGFSQGQTFVEMLEDTYVAFRRAIELMVLNNTCQCNACANVSSLDLKFFVHYGQFGRQKLSADDELVGSDVNLIHRLLKNHVVEETGFGAYTLFTDAAVQSMGLKEAGATVRPLTEEYDHLGQVQIWVQDMRPVWQEKRESTRVPFPEERIAARASADVGMSPEQVWDYLATPEHRSVLIGSDRQEVLDRKDGRVGPGSAYQCYHGDRIIVNIILEWRPFERILTRDLAETPIGDLYIVAEYQLEPTESGTQLTKSMSRATGSLLVRTIFNTVVRLTKKQSQQAIDHFKDYVEADLAARGQAAPE